GSDPFVTPEQAATFGVDLVTFDDIVARADIVTVHVPKTKTTAGMINREVMARMKPGVILLNVARGGIIDEQDLADALRDGTVAAGGHRVFTAEAPGRTPPLDR